MYSDPNMINQKAEQADMVVQAVQQFGQQLPLNLKEIFIWYFEQRGVDNPERFLGGDNEDGSLSQFQAGNVEEGAGVNNEEPFAQLQGVNSIDVMSQLQAGNAGASPQSSMDVLAQLQNLAQQSQQPEQLQVPQGDDSQAIETLLALLFTHPMIMQKLQDVVGKERAEKFMEELEDIQEEINNAI